MAEELELGAVVVGTGFGVLTHLRALQAAGFGVRALVGRDPQKAAHRAAMFDVPHACTSLAEALELDGVDVVAVATPPTTHGPFTLQAVAAGKHVVCEKPFARHLDEARAMLAAAEQAGIVHLIGTEFRFAPGQAQLARAVTGGAIGEPRLGVFLLQLPTLVDPSAVIPPWWEDATLGGGWLGAYGSHIIDQIRTTLGEFESLSATLETLAPRPAMTADDTYTVHFRLTNGAEGIMHSSCGTAGPFLAATKVSGTRGSAWLEGDDLWIDDGSGPHKAPVPDDLRSEPPVPPPGELLHTAYDMWHSMGTDLHPFTRLYGVLRDRILGRPVAPDPAAGTFADGVAIQAVMDAVHRSAAERRWVEVER